MRIFNMNPKIPAHIKAGLAVIFLLVLYPRGLHHPIRGGAEDSVERYIQRFAPAKDVLPSHGVLGFIAGYPPEQVRPSNEYKKRWYMAQYSLSPLIVLNSTQPEKIIGDVRNQEELERIKASGKLAIVRDFGKGVFLFRRIGQ